MTTIRRVSIGLPVFNGERYLASAIQAILKQTFEDFELIISDNASTDQTEAICLRYASEDSRIRYYRQASNLGAVANFEFVLRKAFAPLFMWFAADDNCDADLVAHLVECHDNDSCVVLAATDVVNLNINNEYQGITCLDEIRSDSCCDWRRRRVIFFKNPTSSIFFAIYGLYRRTTLASLSMPIGTGLRYVSGSEIPLLAQMACKGKIVSVAVPSKQYRWNYDGMYQREQAKMKPWSRIYNHIDIGLVLILVIHRSKLVWGETVPLYKQVIADLTLGTVRVIARILISHLGRVTAACVG